MTADRFLDVHHLRRDELPLLDPPVPAGRGVVLGTGQQHERIPVQLFRGVPTRVAVVAARYVAQIMAFRAVGAGARVEVASIQPQAWLNLIDLPGGQVAYSRPPGPQVMAGMAQPLLICDEPGPAATPERPALGPWTTLLTVHDFLTLHGLSALRANDLIVLQRVHVEMAQPLRQAFGLTEDFAALLPQLPDDTIAMITSSQATLANLSPTPLELNLLGPPVRVNP